MQESTTEPLPLLRCVSCGGATRRDTVNLAIWSAKGLVVVEGVEALVCNDCHEQSYDDATASALRKLTSDGFPQQHAIREMSVPVFSLPPIERAELQPPPGPGGYEEPEIY